MATKQFITKENLTKFATLAKTDIKKAQTTADNAVTAAAGALAEAQKKIAKGALATINGQSLENGGNIELDFTVAEVVTALPDIAKASKSKIYLVPSSDTETNNSYSEYIKVTVSGTDKWEKVGEYKADVELEWSAIKNKPSTFTPSTHTHTKSQITDFPTSMPASDVKAWAKADTKPTYTKAEVGLGNVDNTSDQIKATDTSNPIGKALSELNTNMETLSGELANYAETTYVEDLSKTLLKDLKLTQANDSVTIYKDRIGKNAANNNEPDLLIAAATSTVGGLMPAADKEKLDRITISTGDTLNFVELKEKEIEDLWKDA